MEFIKWLQPEDLRSDASHIKTNSCCSDTNKHTHTFTHFCTNLVSLKRKGRHAAHTQARVEGQLDVSPQFSYQTIIHICGDDSFTKTQHKYNRGCEHDSGVQPSGRFGDRCQRSGEGRTGWLKLMAAYLKIYINPLLEKNSSYCSNIVTNKC